ncbi:hypothetical protein [Ralstonia solanacearum]|uniref:hypothetical protein n=1 Tax=Ralstonia solanacearum TaxID=305 RepID=UPI001E3C5B92|nr:hypothetical protein [Ralstonia solanacearum]
MKRLIALTLLAGTSLACFSAQPSFRERYDGLAKTMAPALAIRECTSNKSSGPNRDTLTECALTSPGAVLSLGGLNNKLTGVLLQLNVNQLENPADLMKAGRILLRIARNKDSAREDSMEMTAMVVEAQNKLGKNICEDTPTQGTRFCLATDDKKSYRFAITNLKP